MLYRLKIKIKAFAIHFVMRLFASPENYIKWYVNKKGGMIKTNDNGRIVNQSEAYYQYCRNEGYKHWKNNA
tara:strand:+ start:1011 stop:1223 length:213 start_codon:yes stop_codon:yes gene_type:complete